MSKRIDPVQRIVDLFSAMSPFERGRVAQAMAMIEPAAAKPAKPVGMRRVKANGAVVQAEAGQ